MNDIDRDGMLEPQMSDRDRELVAATGYSVAQIADILGKSRQTVSRGIRKPPHYFSIPELRDIVEHFKKNRPDLAPGILNVVCEFYPELASSVIATLSSPDAEMRLGEPGEYWFVCPDVIQFRQSYSRCLSKIEELLRRQDVQLIAFVRASDLKSANRLFKNFGGENIVQVFTCEDLVIGGMQTGLIHNRIDGKADMYIARKDGFEKLNGVDAARVCYFVSDNLLSPENKQLTPQI